MHGTEPGIELLGDLEIAIQTEMLTVALPRSIEVGGVHGSIKGGEYEMTFHKLKESTMWLARADPQASAMGFDDRATDC